MGFFVNAAGGKDDPIVIGQSEKPRCFKNLKDASRPYKCHYFAYKKAWMNSDLMTDILVSLNRRLQLKQRKIMLFMDNTPCNRASLQDKFSNINIVFLPKNTTSKPTKLTRRTILLREKNFQDCRNLSRQWKYRVLQKSF